MQEPESWRATFVLVRYGVANVSYMFYGWGFRACRHNPGDGLDTEGRSWFAFELYRTRRLSGPASR
jgi:hypothetical protein